MNRMKSACGHLILIFTGANCEVVDFLPKKRKI